MTTITIENVSEKLASIGAVGHHQPKGQGWHRVYIQVPNKDNPDAPFQIGRVMFENGEFRWVKWYNEPGLNPSTELSQFDVYWARWVYLHRTEGTLSNSGWLALCEFAAADARQAYANRRQSRALLNAARVAQGKKPRGTRVAPANVRGALVSLLTELIEHVNTPPEDWPHSVEDWKEHNRYHDELCKPEQKQ